MEFITPQLIVTIALNMVGYIVSGSIVYGVIKTNLANLKEDLSEHKKNAREDLKEVHDRIDSCLFGRRANDKN